VVGLAAVTVLENDGARPRRVALITRP
jgi:hypothetical protein